MSPKPNSNQLYSTCTRRFAYSLGHGDCLTAGLEQRCDPDRLSDEAAIQHVDLADLGHGQHGWDFWPTERSATPPYA